MKKQCNNGKLGRQINDEGIQLKILFRPLVRYAQSNPAIAPMGESPMAKFNQITKIKKNYSKIVDIILNTLYNINIKIIKYAATVE